MRGLRLILASSADGVLAMGRDDPMHWTGKDDKTAFRLLTQVGGVCAAGRTTWKQLPKLKGRRVMCLSRTPGYAMSSRPLLTKYEAIPIDATCALEHTVTLGGFAHAHPGGWLLGGPTVAQEALDAHLVDQVFMCRAPAQLRGGPFDGDFIPDRITPQLRDGPQWHLSQRIRLGETDVECWSRGERPMP